MQKKLDEIADLILKKTVERNIPTVVFLSEIEETDLIKKLFSLKTQKEYNEQNFTPKDWEDLADTILKLANIPLIIKNITSVETTLEHINNFCTELQPNNGYVIINCGKNDFSNIKQTPNVIVDVI